MQRKINLKIKNFRLNRPERLFLATGNWQLATGNWVYDPGLFSFHDLIGVNGLYNVIPF